MANKIITIKRLPSYNKYMSDEFRLKENDKFFILEVMKDYYKLRSIRLKRDITLLKTYFSEEEVVSEKKPIVYND